MLDYQKEFISYALECGVLRFGEFQLKSGRISPYFFNTGLFNTGAKLDKLGHFYAQTLIHSDLKADILYGPAYKGIPLVSTASIAYARLTGTDMPEPSEYLRANQKDGKPLGADALFIETWRWLKERACDQFISPRLVEAYAQAFARYIQCEEAISAYGLLGRHPTTGGAIASPFVNMSQSFQKQANLLWYEIFDVVKQNCTTAFAGNPQDDIMEALLTGRKGKR